LSRRRRNEKRSAIPIPERGVTPIQFESAVEYANSLERTRAAKGTDREKDEQQRHRHGNSNQPVRHIARPRPKGGIQPAQRKDRENRADSFVEKLFQRTPKPLESARLRHTRRKDRHGHKGILTQRNRRREPPPVRTDRGVRGL
jgi:hypothetical protein